MNLKGLSQAGPGCCSRSTQLPGVVNVERRSNHADRVDVGLDQVELYQESRRRTHNEIFLGVRLYGLATVDEQNFASHTDCRSKHYTFMTTFSRPLLGRTELDASQMYPCKPRLAELPASCCWRR